MMRPSVFRLAVAVVIAVARGAVALPAFPGAEGFGANTPGGRGGSVVEVTSLADAGSGTLRAALEDTTGPRTVVFRVSGTIALSQHLRLDSESHSFVTIAGQTAPGDGVQLANYGIQLLGGVHDVVIRYLRIRPSDGSGTFSRDIDAVELWGSDDSHVHDIIVDHCSLQWAMDENLSAWGRVTDVTVQRSIVAEALLVGQDRQHAKGVLIGAAGEDQKPDRFSFHHVLFAHNPDRNPRIAYATTDFRNNIVYDYGGNNSTLFGPYGGFPPGPHTTDVNLVNNIWKNGPATYADYNAVAWVNPNTRLYLRGNRGPLCPTGCADEWAIGVREEFGSYGPAAAGAYRVTSPFAAPAVTIYAVDALSNILLANVGASRPVRDAVDARIVADVTAGTGTTGQGSGYPVLAAGAVPPDDDHDGMPDAWELTRGLSPTDPTDRNGDDDGDGYTNLEEYLHELGPTEFGCGDGIVHPGEACDDANTIDGDGCDANCTITACGNGIRTSGEACDDGNTTAGDCCAANCQFEAVASACDDANLCTTADACDGAGACAGTATPAITCKAADKGSLSLDARSQKLVWKWTKGDATTAAELGNPLNAGSTYALCAYDTLAALPSLVLRADFSASAAAWRVLGDGTLKYASKSGAPGGIVAAKLSPGVADRARLLVKARSVRMGSSLAVPPLPFSEDPSVTVQLRSSTGACWSQSYVAPARRNDARQFSDSVP